MDLNPIVLSIPLYFILIGVELLIQLRAKRKLYRLNDALANISCGITQQITGVFLKVLSVTAYVLLFESLRLTTIPVTWWSGILVFIAADFCYYWAHRMSHEINLFWGGHVVHHQSEDYNLSVALRQGSFQIVWTFAFFLPLAIIGFDPMQFVIINGLVTVYQFWIHTETIKRMPRWFEAIFNTPSHHRVHHGRDPKYIDKNHAGVFIIWDKMFGTFQQEEEAPTYGITTPLNSWNPVYANFHHYAMLWQHVKAAKGFDKVRVLFNKPGWRPAYNGGYMAPPAIDKAAYRKYDRTAAAPGVVGYAMTQYILSLVVTALFLFEEARFSWVEKGMITGFIILTVVTVSALFDQRKYVFSIEFLRLLGSVALAAYFSQGTTYMVLATIIGAVYALLSAGWLASIKKRQPNVTPMVNT